MKLQIDQLISEYTSAQHELNNLLSKISHPSDEMVSKLDNKLQLAFDSLISAKFESNISHLRRINFLISVIKSMECSNGIISQMLDTIRDDVNATIDLSNDNDANVVSLFGSTDTSPNKL